MDILTEFQLLGKIVLASILGGVVGLEREYAEKPAGLRTHMLVAGGSALLVMVGIRMVTSFGPLEYIMIDPLRIIEAIVVGISFLGAGTILKRTDAGQSTVEGLTTSASILFVAIVGIAVALDDIVLAVGAVLLNLFINWGLLNLVRMAKSKTK